MTTWTKPIMLPIPRAPSSGPSQQPHGAVGYGHHAGRGLQARAAVRVGTRVENRRSCASRDRGDKRARSRCEYRQGPGMAGACEYCNDSDL